VFDGDWTAGLVNASGPHDSHVVKLVDQIGLKTKQKIEFLSLNLILKYNFLILLFTGQSIDDTEFGYLVIGLKLK
jgi:hypothetical protein